MTEEPAPVTAPVTLVGTGRSPAEEPANLCRPDGERDAGAGRRRVRVTGVVAEVQIAPAHDRAEFSALVIAHDPAQPRAERKQVRLVWQGQRAVPGVTVGVALECVGLLCDRRSEPTIFNPRYEIVAKKVQR